MQSGAYSIPAERMDRAMLALKIFIIFLMTMGSFTALVYVGHSDGRLMLGGVAAIAALTFILLSRVSSLDE